MRRFVSIGREFGLVGFAGMLMGISVGAQTTPPPSAPLPVTPASTNVQDYSQGFRAFIRLGLPDNSKAKYVKLNSYSGNHDNMSSRLYEIQLSGNAWLLSENKDDKSTLLSAVGRSLELFDQKTFMKKQEVEAKSNALAQATAGKKGDGKVFSATRLYRADQWGQIGNWTPADLSRDLAKATAYLDKKIKAKAAGGREVQYDGFLQSDEPAGLLFIFAAFAWQNGMTQEANILAGRLFTLVGDSRKVIVGALNVMADAQLTEAMENFRKTGDWNAYHNDVTKLVKKYPAGWRKVGAAQLLADRLQVRASMAQPPVVTGEGLGEDDQKLAADLVAATNRPGMNMWSGQLWIFPPPKAMRMMKDDSVLGRIKARGVKSIPLLLALANDETLCSLQRGDLGLPVVYSYSSNDAGKPEAERARDYYMQMERPLTRGEISRALLTPLCRRELNAHHNETEVAPEEVVEGVKKIYEVLKDLPVSGLASYFLKNGDQNQKQAAISYMIESDVASNAPVIEAYLLTPPAEEEGMQMMGYESGFAQQYVQKRGEKAAEFVEKYLAMKKKIELPARFAENEEYAKQMKKQAEREVKLLQSLVKKQDLTTTVADLANSSKGDEGAMMAYTALGRQPPAKAVPALLAVVVQNTNVAVRVRILQMMPMLRYSGMQEAEQGEMADAEPEAMEAAMKKLAEKNKLNINSNAADWKILMADTRLVPGAAYSGGGYTYMIADLAADAIESLYADTSPAEQYSHRGEYANLNPEVRMKVSRARAVARLEGKSVDQLPKFPSPDDVTAERRKVIEADVLKATPAALGAMLDQLNDSEIAYLTEAAKDNEAITKALAPLSRRIATVKVMTGLPVPEATRIQKLAGTMVGTNAIIEMRELCKRQLATGSVVAVTLSSSGLGKGLRLEVSSVDPSAKNQFGYDSMLNTMGKGKKGLVMGLLRSGMNNGYGIWVVDLQIPAKTVGSSTGTVAVVDSEDDGDDRINSFSRMFSGQQEQFDSAVEAFCNTIEPIGPGASVSFTGTMPPKKNDKKNDNGTDNEDTDVEMIE